MTRSSDVLIIGGGMAGLVCALELPSRYSVTVLSKTALPTGSTYLAQGGWPRLPHRRTVLRSTLRIQ